MKLRLGEPVRATDGEFGELADIVVDPVTKCVTHLIVEPHHRHVQSRLVPIALVAEDGEGGLAIGLDRDHVRDLQRVSFAEFVRLGTPIDVGDEWDIGDQTVIVQPYWSGDLVLAGPASSDQVEVIFDRIPKGECEIRRESAVVDRLGRAVGRVEGLVVDEQHVTGVVVRSGLPGFSRLSVAALDAVIAVSADGIRLSIDRTAFDELPGADDLFAPDGGASVPSPLQAQVATIVHHTARRFRRFRAGLSERANRNKRAVERLDWSGLDSEDHEV